MRNLPFVLLLPALSGCMNFDQFVGGDGESQNADGGSGSADLGRGALDLSGDPQGDAGPPDMVFTCHPDKFFKCKGNFAYYCNPEGTDLVAFDCGAACVGPDGCGLCAPGESACANGVASICNDKGSWKDGVQCVTVGNVGPMCNGNVCAECAPNQNGDSVCGDGVNYNTVLDTQYVCNQGVIGVKTACNFGCDSANGKCHDLVPANEALGHLSGSMGEIFTCTGAKNLNLPILTVQGQANFIDTGTANVVMNNIQIPVLWGPAYVPKGGSTTVRVAHVGGVKMSPGSSLSIKGKYALLLLVDGDVSIGGDANSMSVVTSNAFGASSSGAGANASAGLGGSETVNTPLSGGGGAGGATHGGNGRAGSKSLVFGGMGGQPYGANFVLDAGTRGGNGLGVNGSVVAGGNGGGALQISACGNIDLLAGSAIVLNGGGGAGGPKLTSAGGGGGGSGGTLIVEGTMVSTAGLLFANGGGGGEGSSPLNQVGGAAGSDGKASSNPAPGGNLSQSGAGGAGGAGKLLPGDGGPSTSDMAGGGGGGGSVGRIFIGVSPLQKPPLPPVSSPPAYPASVCITQNAMVVGCMY